MLHRRYEDSLLRRFSDYILCIELQELHDTVCDNMCVDNEM